MTTSRLPRWLPALCALFPWACGPGSSDTAPIERVILITCDTLRADRLGAYGYRHPTTPNLDAFARESVVFDRAWSTAPMTTPAVSSIFTGRLPDELGVLSNKVQIAPEAISVTEIVQRAGIETAAVLSNYVLARRGLEEAGLQQGFDHYDDAMTTQEANRKDMFERDARGTTDAAIAWLRFCQESRFFLWVHYQDPHGPYTPPADCLEALDRPLTREPALRVGDNQRGLGSLPRYQALDGLTEPEAYRIRYDAEIRYFDRELGRLLDELRTREALDGALVIVTADHGESMGERDFWFSHGQHLHEELVRVPFLVRYPDGRPHPPTRVEDGYERCGEMVSHLDLMPTILDAFGLEGPPVYGTSLLQPALGGERLVAHMGAGWYGVTDGRYRTMTSKVGTRLFDVQADPFERNDLAPTDRRTSAELVQRLQRLKEELPEVRLEGVEVDRRRAADEANLRALGYVEDGQEEH